jgi:4-hydroxy-3-methylbut-2-enyl diphosphate reductase
MWETLKGMDINLIDATCPKVAQIQRLVAHNAKEGFRIIIWGTCGHPEVEGLLGFGGEGAVVVRTPEELLELDSSGKALLVAQTTQDIRAYGAIKEAALLHFGGKVTIRDTICEATKSRQDELVALASKVDGLVVVGGKDSGNTKRLYNIGLELGAKSIIVEEPDSIPEDFTQDLSSVAIGAGASTPIWQIRKVSHRLRALDRQGQGSPLAFIHRLLRALVLSRIYMALGTGSLGCAMSLALGISPPALFFGLFFYFGHAMHILNGFLDRDSARYNDPDLASFLYKYRLPMILAGVMSLSLSLSAAYLAGCKIFLLTLFQAALGLMYAIPLPFGFLAKRGIRRLKDLPFAKLIAISGGWALFVIAPDFLHNPPLLSFDLHGLKLAALGFSLVFTQVFVRTFLMEMQDARGDRIFSSSTLSAILGLTRSAWLITSILALWTIALILSYFLMGASLLILFFILTGPLYNGLVLKRFFLNPWLGGFQFDLLLDTQFLLAGVAALLWTYLS